MDKHPPLKDFCHSQAIYTRIRNALWSANGFNSVIPKRWEPQPKHFTSLESNAITNIGEASLKILRAWIASND